LKRRSFIELSAKLALLAPLAAACKKPAKKLQAVLSVRLHLQVIW